MIRIAAYAYAFCNIRPHELWDLTPEEIQFMVAIRSPPPDDKPPEQRQRDNMDDNMMEHMVSKVLHPVINAIGGR